MPPVPDSLTTLRIALVAAMIGSIAPGGQGVESCRLYAFIVQAPSPRDSRAVFMLGDAREPGSFKFERLDGGLSVRLSFQAADCLTYELVAAHKSPTLRTYEIDVRPDTVAVRLARE